MPYPRSLSPEEEALLIRLLPENIPGYKAYNNFLNSSQVIGIGRWGEGNLLLDKTSSPIDLTLGMPPVVAYGECFINNEPLAVSVHELNIDGQLEVQFSGVFPIPSSPNVSDFWCYSYWKSGEPCPATNQKVREVLIKDSQASVKYILAISIAKKVLWLHHATSGFNQLLPLTNFYDELLRTKHIRDAKLISRPASFFGMVDDFTDNEFIKALLEYDKKASRKFDTTGIVIETEKPKKSIFQKLFGK